MRTRIVRGDDLPRARRVLVIAAHPDDIESWCAGTLVLFRENGAELFYLLCTRGDKGSADPEATQESVARAREAEQMGAGRVLGVSDIRFLSHADGGLEDTHPFRGELVREIRRVRPDIVFTHDPVHPYPEYTVHRDHRIVGRAALDCAYPFARDRLSFPEHEAEGLSAHEVGEAWLFSSGAPDTWVEIGRGFERKISARLAHHSQTPDPEGLRRSWRARAERVGDEADLELAESFKVVRLR